MERSLSVTLASLVLAVSCSNTSNNPTDSNKLPATPKLTPTLEMKKTPQGDRCINIQNYINDGRLSYNPSLRLSILTPRINHANSLLTFPIKVNYVPLYLKPNQDNSDFITVIGVCFGEEYKGDVQGIVGYVLSGDESLLP